MGRRKLSNEEKELTRSKLLDHAQALFVEQGYDGVSIRSIAKTAECSSMLPYRYFENKEAIFDAVRCRAFERFADEQETIALKEANPVNRIRALGQAYSRFADRHTNEFRLMFELSQPHKPSTLLKKAEKRSFVTLRTALEEAVAAQQLQGDPAILAHMYWTALHGIVTLDLAGKLVHGVKKRKLLDALFRNEKN